MKESRSHYDLAKVCLERVNDTPINDPSNAIAHAITAVAYSNLAVLDYIMKRDAEPFNEQKQLLQLGMNLGKEFALQEKAETDGKSGD